MRTHYSHYYAYFLCLARTGMREGEALGLTGRIFSVDMTPRIPIGFCMSSGPMIQSTTCLTPRRVAAVGVSICPKNSGQYSSISATSVLTLRSSPARQPSLRWSSVDPRAGRCAPQLYRIHRRVCALAGLRVTRVHDLRHSYATIQLYEHHAPIQYVSEQLGHSSIKITVDTYGHPRQGTSIALADRLDSPGTHALRYAPSAQLERLAMEEQSAISTT